jgi:hypothetical protein
LLLLLQSGLGGLKVERVNPVPFHRRPTASGMAAAATAATAEIVTAVTATTSEMEAAATAITTAAAAGPPPAIPGERPRFGLRFSLPFVSCASAVVWGGIVASRDRA